MEQRVETYRQRAIWVALIIIALMFAFVCWDYLVSVYLPLHPDRLREITFNDGDREFDWSVSCGFAGVTRSCGVTETFAAVAYLIVPGAMACLAFGSFLYMILLSIFTFTTTPKGTYRILPDFGSKDRRRGFEHLEPLFENMTLGIGLSLFTIYMMSVQNIYLRTADSPNIFEYFQRLVLHNIDAFDSDGVWAGIKTFVGGGIGGGTDGGIESTIGLMLSALVSFIALILFYWSLRASAQAARNLGCSIIEDQESGAPASEKPALTAKLGLIKNMQVWPLRWASLTLLLVTAIILTAGTFFPSLVTLVAVAIVYLFIKSLIARYLPRKDA